MTNLLNVINNYNYIAQHISLKYANIRMICSCRPTCRCYREMPLLSFQQVKYSFRKE